MIDNIDFFSLRFNTTNINDNCIYDQPDITVYNLYKKLGNAMYMLKDPVGILHKNIHMGENHAF